MKKIKDGLLRAQTDVRFSNLHQEQGWTTLLQAVVHSWNVTRSAATGYAPATIFFGRRIRHPAEARETTPMLITDPHYVSEERVNSAVVADAVAERREAQQVRRHAYFDRNEQRLVFPPGSLVRKCLETVGAQNKAMIKTVGLFLVLRRINDSTYQLGYPQRDSIKRSYP